MPFLLEEFTQQLWSGDPDFFLPGSGLAQPGGLEDCIQYNGITLHDRSVLDKYRLTMIDGLHGGPRIRSGETVNPSDHGYTPLTNFLEGRSVTLEGTINAGNIAKMRDMQQALRTAFFSMVERPLIVRTGNPARDVYIMARNTDQIGLRDAQQKKDRFTRDFQINMRATDPRIYSLVAKSYALEELVDGDNTIDVDNMGNFPASPVIRLVGPLTNPVISCGVSLPDEGSVRRIEINGEIAAGEIYTYDAADGTMEDQLGFSQTKKIAIGARDIRLGSGTTTLNLNATDTDVDSSFEVSLKDTWI